MRPRIRSVKPEMRQDERYCALGRDARELFNGLITLADDEGRFRARRSEIVGRLFPADEDAPALIDGWINEVKEQGMVLFYIVDGTPYGAFRNWRRHQRINKATSSQLPPPPDPKVVRDNRVPKKGAGTERSGSSTGEGREDDSSPTSLMRGRALRSDPIQIRSLCDQLALRIRENDAKADPKPDSERWLTEMRLLVVERQGDVAEVARMIDWSQADGFWRSNILSPAKLRKQFTQLVLKASAAGVVRPLRPDNADALIRKLRAAEEAS